MANAAANEFPAPEAYVHPEFGPIAIRELANALNALLADAFVLFVKTASFQWHVSGSCFHEYRALLGEQAAGVFSIIGPLAERVRKLGGRTVASLDDVLRWRRIGDGADPDLDARRMLEVLGDDNRQWLCCLRETHGLCEEYGDVATRALLETWIDDAEARLWHLHEASRPSTPAPSITDSPAVRPATQGEVT